MAGLPPSGKHLLPSRLGLGYIRQFAADAWTGVIGVVVARFIRFLPVLQPVFWAR